MKRLYAFLLAAISTIAAHAQAHNPAGLYLDETTLALNSGTVTVADPTADGGTAIFRPATAGAATMWFGPYIKLQGGNYLVQFRLKVSANQPNAYLGTIDIVSTAGGTIFGSLRIYLDMFRAGGEWQLFTLPIHAPDNVTDFEFRGIDFQSGVTGLYLDYINIIPGDIRGNFSNEFTVTGTGAVGIGTLYPNKKLSVAGDMSLTGNNGTHFWVYDNDLHGYMGYRIRTDDAGGWRWQFVDGFDDEYFGVDYPSGNTTVKGRLLVNNATDDNSSALQVNGDIRARRLKVTQTGWPDYVFQHDYHLPALNELEGYINRHQHLPGIPTAAEVEREGLDVGEMNKKLLQKIEELTLYLIRQEKKIEEQQRQIDQLLKGR